MSDCKTVSCPEGYYCTTHKCYAKLGVCPWQRLDEIEIENERLENLLAEGVHSCSQTCKRPMCVLRREKAELEQQLAERQWISVEDRLPEDRELVLSVDKGGRVYNSQYLRGEFKCVGLVWEHSNVTHWMKLPEPPQEQDNE